MTSVRDTAFTVLFALMITISGMVGFATADGSDSEYITVTATPSQEYYDVEDDEDLEKNVTFEISSFNLENGKNYRISFTLLTSPADIVVSNTLYNTQRTMTMHDFSVDWEEGENYTLVATLQKENSNGTYLTIDSDSISFIIGDQPEEESETGTTYTPPNYNNFTTNQSVWKCDLTIAEDELTAEMINKKWLNSAFVTALDSNSDGTTSDEEIANYTRFINDGIDVDDIESPMLLIDGDNLSYSSVEFFLEMGNPVLAVYRMVSESVTLGNVETSFQIDVSEEDNRNVDEWGLLTVELVSDDWHISSVTTPRGDQGLTFTLGDDGVYSASKQVSYAMPDVKVILAPNLEDSDSQQTPSQPVVECELWLHELGTTNSTLITNQLHGDYNLKLAVGEYEFELICNQGNQLNNTWQLEVQPDMSEPIELVIQWSDPSSSGQINLTVTKDMEPCLILPDGRVIPGFTSVFATLGLLGAAFIRRR